MGNWAYLHTGTRRAGGKGGEAQQLARTLDANSERPATKVSSQCTCCACTTPNWGRNLECVLQMWEYCARLGLSLSDLSRFGLLFAQLERIRASNAALALTVSLWVKGESLSQSGGVVGGQGTCLARGRCNSGLRERINPALLIKMGSGIKLIIQKKKKKGQAS